jgi:tetratricopeptide (TPR) repeat protein
MSQGDGSRALLAARQALSIDAESPEVHNLLGCIWAMEGDFEEAMSCWQQAIDLDEDYLDPLLNMADVLIHSAERPDEAVDLCRKARELIEEEEELVEIVMLEADAFLSMSRREEARKALTAIENFEFENPIHFMLVGRALFEAGDVNKSKELIDKSLSIDPSSADAWYCRGLICREEGRRVDAAAAFAKVQKEDSGKTPPSWIASTSVENLVKTAISRLDAETQAMLLYAEIHVAPLPSLDQVMDEVDPRQAVFAQCIDPDRKSFLHLWVYFLNFDYAGVLPMSPESDLAALIQDELLFNRR